MFLIDTDIVVDVLREHAPAVAWLAEIGNQEILLSGFVAAEIVQGCRTAAQERRVTEFMSGYRKVWPGEETCNRALALFTRYHLTNGLGIIDALIGQTALDLALPLYTFNVKHYDFIPGLQVIRPYLK